MQVSKKIVSKKMVVLLSVKLVWNTSLLRNLNKNWKRQFLNSSAYSLSPGTFKIYKSFHKNDLQDLIEELILKEWRMLDSALKKFKNPGFIFSD